LFLKSASERKDPFERKVFLAVSFECFSCECENILRWQPSWSRCGRWGESLRSFCCYVRSIPSGIRLRRNSSGMLIIDSRSWASHLNIEAGCSVRSIWLRHRRGRDAGSCRNRDHMSLTRSWRSAGLVGKGRNIWISFTISWNSPCQKQTAALSKGDGRKWSTKYSRISREAEDCFPSTYWQVLFHPWLSDPVFRGLAWTKRKAKRLMLSGESII
jgi:hypothetical protein